MTTIATEPAPTKFAATICARCDSDVELAPFDLPAPGQPDRKVCATEDGQIGAAACGVTDLQIAISRALYEAAHQDGPRGDATAAAKAANPLLDTIGEAIGAYVVHESSVWTAIAQYALSKSTQLMGGTPC